MSKTINTIAFGTLYTSPVLIIDEAGYVLLTRNNRWSKLKAGESTKVVRIKTSTFLRRYEECLQLLPNKLKRAIVPLKLDGKLVGICRSKPSDLFCYAETITRKAKVISLLPHIERQEKLKGIFNLGRHTYSGGPGFCWTCDYRIERLNDDGSLWDILATDGDSDEFQSMGNHTLAEAQEYFEGVHFSITQDEWVDMGASFPPEPEDDTCAFCHKSLSEYSDRSGYHKCNMG